MSLLEVLDTAVAYAYMSIALGAQDATVSIYFVLLCTNVCL